MSSKGVLYIVISGPDDYQRAIEGIRMAEYQSGDGSHGVALMLQGEGVEWLREHPLPYTKGHWRYYDFYLPQHKLLIEVDGDYWHNSQGKPSWVIMAAKKNDMLKNWIAKKEGYRLIRIREKEIQENFSLVRERITEELS